LLGTDRYTEIFRPGLSDPSTADTGDCCQLAQQLSLTLHPLRLLFFGIFLTHRPMDWPIGVNPAMHAGRIGLI
jgi:hypothetical protein